jgi:hypothetical protein
MIDTDDLDNMSRRDLVELLEAYNESLAEVKRLRYIVDSIPDEVWKDMKTWEAMKGVIE